MKEGTFFPDTLYLPFWSVLGVIFVIFSLNYKVLMFEAFIKIPFLLAWWWC